MDSYSVWLTVPVSTNRIWRATGNSAKPIIKSKAYRSWIELSLAMIPRRPKFTKKVSVTIELFAKPKCGVMDIGNLEKATMDMLVKAGVIGGDSRKWVSRIVIEDRGLAWTGNRLNMQPGEDGIYVTVENYYYG